MQEKEEEVENEDVEDEDMEEEDHLLLLND